MSSTLIFGAVSAGKNLAGFTVYLIYGVRSRPEVKPIVGPKNAITGKSHHLILYGAIICATSLTTAAARETNPNSDHIVLPSGQILTPSAVPGAQLQYLTLGHYRLGL